MSASDAVQQAVGAAAAARQRGNELFKAGRHEEAVVAYTDAHTAATSEGSRSLASLSKDERSEAITAIVNRALCWLKLSKYEECVKDCTSVLNVEPGNEKALFRRATAHEVRAV